VSGVRVPLAERVSFVNSFQRVLRRGVHQGWDLWEGREWGAVASIVAVRVERAEENHWSSWVGEGVSGRGGICHLLSLLVRFDQSASCQGGLGLSLWGDGGCREINMGVWSDPGEGRVDVSRERKEGKICGLAKVVSIALGLWVFVRGNQV